MLALIIAVGSAGGWASARLGRGRIVGWLLLPVLAALGVGLSWFLNPQDPFFGSAGLSLGLAMGGGLGAAAHSDWNTRRSVGLGLAVLALSVEGALVLGVLGQGRAASASPSWMLLLAGLGLAFVGARRGVLPQQAAWSARLRWAVSLCAVFGVGLWWGHTEWLADHTVPSLAGDLVANVTHQGAWAVWGAAAVAGVLLLGASDAPWVRRFGASLALGCAVAMPWPALGMRWAVQRQCDAHLPEPVGVFDAIPSDPPIEIPEGWCRAPTTPSLRCPSVPTLYQQSTGTGFVVRRLERDPLDTLWGERWGRPSSVLGETLRLDTGTLHLGDWLVSTGNREPSDLDGTLEDFVDRALRCGGAQDAVPGVVLDLQIDSLGRVQDLALRGTEGLGAEDLSCLEDQARALEFPVSSCRGVQRVMVPFYLGSED